MKIAILGGSFDPPHLGHILISQQVMELLKIDLVWLMPLYGQTALNEVFHKKLSRVADRLAMAEFLESKFIRVSDFEIRHNQASLTIDTLNALKKFHPEHTFFWITGSDQLGSFQKYKRWEEIVQNHNLIIFPREHMLLNLEEQVKTSLHLQTIPKNVIVLQNKSLILTNISSTAIRERVRKRLPIKYLVPERVEEYIRKHGLYT